MNQTGPLFRRRFDESQDVLLNVPPRSFDRRTA
jgi:hypothetical protein